MQTNAIAMIIICSIIDGVFGRKNVFIRSKVLKYSVIIPTYNSGRTIIECLDGIRNQNFDQGQIEILVIDGGSTDITIEVAKEHDAVVIENPYRLPEPAKLIGQQHAKGKYICIMGSDEILTDMNIFQKRFDFLEKHQEIHGLLAELVAPRDYSPICTYMNAVGDPFTCFVYQIYGDREYTLRKYLERNEDGANIYHFMDTDIIPIGDGGTVMNMEYIRSEHPDMVNTHESSVLWDAVIRDNGYVACIPEDKITHLSKSDFRTYINKLKFRVINNIHNKSGAGYAFRAKTDKSLSRRKYIYPFYCLCLPWLFFDAIQMSFRMKNKVFMLHPLFAWYVMIEIVIQYIKKLFGRTSVNVTYGQEFGKEKRKKRDGKY